MAATRTCPRCGETFTAKDARTVYCSKRCAATRDLPTKTCETCGQTFRKDPNWSLAYWNERRFCSRKCRGNSKPLRRVPCEHCGTEFETRRLIRDERFCSTRCYGDWVLAQASLEPKASGDFSAATKRALLARASYQCQRCDATEHLEFDHVIPQAAGGEGTVENGQVLCRPCHLVKTLDERRLMRTLLRAHFGLTP